MDAKDLTSRRESGVVPSLPWFGHDRREGAPDRRKDGGRKDGWGWGWARGWQSRRGEVSPSRTSLPPATELARGRARVHWVVQEGEEGCPTSDDLVSRLLGTSGEKLGVDGSL